MLCVSTKRLIDCQKKNWTLTNALEYLLTETSFKKEKERYVSKTNLTNLLWIVTNLTNFPLNWFRAKLYFETVIKLFFNVFLLCDYCGEVKFSKIGELGYRGRDGGFVLGVGQKKM